MRSKILLTIMTALLALSACGQRDENTDANQRDENTDGNGPGNADGFGGRADPQPPAHQEPEQQPSQ